MLFCLAAGDRSAGIGWKAGGCSLGDYLKTTCGKIKPVNAFCAILKQIILNIIFGEGRDLASGDFRLAKRSNSKDRAAVKSK